MANWWNRNYIHQEQKGSVWLFNIEASVKISDTEEEERDKNTAQNVLETVLNKVEGDVSVYTAIDSNIQFQIQSNPIRK